MPIMQKQAEDPQLKGQLPSHLGGAFLDQIVAPAQNRTDLPGSLLLLFIIRIN
jgi:hypothetical protein